MIAPIPLGDGAFMTGIKNGCLPCPDDTALTTEARPSDHVNVE
jgi:hypothetical protein